MSPKTTRALLAEAAEDAKFFSDPSAAVVRDVRPLDFPREMTDEEFDLYISGEDPNADYSDL